MSSSPEVKSTSTSVDSDELDRLSRPELEARVRGLLEATARLRREEYNLRLAQFVLHHFDEMDRKALVACGKGPDPLLHAECEHRLKMSAERARDDYFEVLKLREEAYDLETAIGESKSDVRAEKLKEELNEVNTMIQDRLTKMATQYNFDGKAEFVDQAMSIHLSYDVNRAERPGVLNAFFSTFRAEDL